ncbi:MAG: DUF4143 domain-containing protein [Solirubrobacteraceae bacterium]
MVYESFVAMELHRRISWLDDRPQLFPFRDRDQREVDIVIEHRDGSITAVEVKSAATVHRRDLRGLTHLRDKLGSRFKAGALLYTGADTVPFEDRLAAVPISGLWTDASAWTSAPGAIITRASSECVSSMPMSLNARRTLSAALSGNYGIHGSKPLVAAAAVAVRCSPAAHPDSKALPQRARRDSNP